MRTWALDHCTLVILGVEDEAELCRWEDELRVRGIATEHFREPDLNDQKTAIAVDPAADGRLFRELPLL